MQDTCKAQVPDATLPYMSTLALFQSLWMMDILRSFNVGTFSAVYIQDIIMMDLKQVPLVRDFSSLVYPTCPAIKGHCKAQASDHML